MARVSHPSAPEGRTTAGRATALMFVATAFAALAAPAAADWNWRYYQGSWTTLPDFGSLSPAATGSATVISAAPRQRNDDFGLRFTGKFRSDTAGQYRFQTRSDDGSRLLVNGTAVVNNDGVHAPETVTGTVNLGAGEHDIVVDFFERAGGEVLEVLVAPPGEGFRPLPNSGSAPPSPADRATLGQWGNVIPWPEIAISAATLPDGRILTWSSTETDSFPSNREYTHASVFDPATETFIDADSNFHDMFCAGLSTLADGTIVASGGNPNDKRTSAFSPIDMSWSARADMNFNRWYGTNLLLPDNDIWSTFAKAAGGDSERYSPANNQWTRTTGASMATLLDEQNASNGQPTVNSASDMQWWAKMVVMPDGQIFHGGPLQTLHVFDATGNGDVNPLGQPLGQRARMWSNAVVYDVGRVLMLGGSDRTRNPATTANVYDIDLNGPSPQITTAAPLNFARTLSNSLTLPTGEIVVIGGNTTGKLFDDNDSIYAAELWSPVTRDWRVLGEMTVPRNYHSVALLLKDGRVLSAGGGACGNCTANHLDGQIYSPPYLFAADGSLRARPAITSAPDATQAAGGISVQTSGDVARFTMVRLSATTHATNTDQRFVPVDSASHSGGSHTLTLNANPNVLLPGNYWLYAVSTDGVPSVGHTIRIGLGTTPDPDPDPTPDLGLFDTSSDIGGVAATGSASHSAGTYTLRGSGADIWFAADEFHFLRREYTGDAQLTARVTSLTNTFEWAKAGVMIRGNASAASPHVIVVVRPDGQVAMQWRTATGVDAEWVDVLVGGTGLPKSVRLTREANRFTGQYLVGSTWTDIGTIDVTLPTTALAGLVVTSHVDGTIATAVIDGVSLLNPAPPTDSDGDGVPDTSDAFPNDPTESADSDGDGTGDNADAFPADASESADSDGDGVGDNADLYPNDADNGRFRARASSTLIVFDDGIDEQAWHVNPDNRTVSAFGMAGTRLAEIAVGRAPWALAKAPLADEVWVANKDDASLSVIDTLTRQVTRTVALPPGSQPHGLVFAPDSDDLFVVLEATGELRHYNAETGDLVDQLNLGHRPRHLSVTADGSELLVTRFITPPLVGESSNAVDTASGGGELMVVNTADLSVRDTVVLTHVNRAVSENRGPGLPNYLGAPIITPDGSTAFVPSKQDNVSTGAQRGGVPGALTFDQSVRAVSSIVDLDTGTEATNSRIDHDNASMASAATMSGDGRYLFVSLETSREIAVIDTQGNVERLRIPVGRAPQGVAVSASGRRLVVHNFMDRTAQFVALDTLVDAGTPDVNTFATTASVSSERLSASVLLGKRLFYDAADDRLAHDNYMSCASCHNDGGSDGRTWDFGQFGEGLRNTPTLRGHGVGHGLLHHTGNFDEVQDFENQIRDFAGGSGLMSNADFAATQALLGSPKAGRSADLDALAAYMSSLDAHPANPYRGSALSAAAQAGQQFAREAGCAGCHAGLQFTDSISGLRHDVGTLTAASGQRSGGTLDGLDTPTLLGAWLTPPYLHDGSAPTLEAAVAAHADVTLSANEIASVAAWLRELDQGDTLEDDGPPPTGCNDCIDFSVTPTVSYSNQDVDKIVAVENGGATLALRDNTWRMTTRTFDITAETVLEFEFASTEQGEFHAIGADDDNSHEQGRMFRLWGTQRSGRSDYATYQGDGEFRRYVIPIGRFYTGDGMNLFFINDNDRAGSAGTGNDSLFRNVRLYSAAPSGSCSDCLDFSSVSTASFSNQDKDQGVQVLDGGTTIALSGNTWRQTNQRFDVTSRTVIEFDFSGTVEGEIHGIGFDEDNTHTGNRIFKVHGTQTWGRLAFDDYVAGSGIKRYRIPVGSYFTGNDMALILVNDRDYGEGAEASFANVRVFED